MLKRLLPKSVDSLPRLGQTRTFESSTQYLGHSYYFSSKRLSLRDVFDTVIICVENFHSTTVNWKRTRLLVELESLSEKSNFNLFVFISKLQERNLNFSFQPLIRTNIRREES